MDDRHLLTLKRLETELVAELSSLPLFKKLESLRNTIRDFEGDGIEPLPALKFPAPPRVPDLLYEFAGIEDRHQIPIQYVASKMTWKDRLLYIINKNPNLGIAELIAEVDRLEPNAHEKKWLYKRVTNTVYMLKEEGLILAKEAGGVFKYSIRKI